MKKIIYLLIFLFTLSGSVFAQEDQVDDGAGKIREKMVEYIQQKLNLSKSEAEKFQPVFMDYLRQLKSTKQEYKSDRMVLQQKIADLRLRTRDQLKPIMGEKRSNEVFTHERDFIQNVIKVRQDRLEDRQEGRANKRFR